MNSIFPLPPALELSGKTVDAFHALPPADQKNFRALVLDALAAYLAARDAGERADVADRAERRNRDAQQKADRHAHFCQYLEGLNLASLEGRVRFFGAMHAGLAPLTEDFQTTGYAIGNTDAEKILIGMRGAKLKNFAVDLPLPDSAMRGVCAWTGERAALDALCAKHGLPDTLEILNPTGTLTRLYSHTMRSRRAQFNGTDVRVNWKLTVTPDHNFGATITDRAIGHLPALPAKLDGWLRSCESGNESNFFELLRA